jgi:hypothetical protein
VAQWHRAEQRRQQVQEVLVRVAAACKSLLQTNAFQRHTPKKRHTQLLSVSSGLGAAGSSQLTSTQVVEVVAVTVSSAGHPAVSMTTPSGAAEAASCN